MSNIEIDDKPGQPLQLLDLTSEILVNIFKHCFPTWSTYIYNDPLKEDTDYFVLFGIPSGALIFTCRAISPLAKSAIRERFDGRIIDVSDTTPWSDMSDIPSSKVQSLVQSFGGRVTSMERPKWQWSTGPSVLTTTWSLLSRLKQIKIVFDNVSQIPEGHFTRFLTDCELSELVEGNLDMKLRDVLDCDGLVEHMLRDYPVTNDVDTVIELSTIAIYTKDTARILSRQRRYAYLGQKREYKLVS